MLQQAYQQEEIFDLPEIVHCNKCSTTAYLENTDGILDAPADWAGDIKRDAAGFIEEYTLWCPDCDWAFNQEDEEN